MVQSVSEKWAECWGPRSLLPKAPFGLVSALRLVVLSVCQNPLKGFSKADCWAPPWRMWRAFSGDDNIWISELWVEQSTLHNVGVCVLSRSVMSDSVTPWTVARQVPPSMGFSRQEYWSGLLCPPPEDLPDSGIEFASLKSPALAGGFFTLFQLVESLSERRGNSVSRWPPGLNCNSLDLQRV